MERDLTKKAVLWVVVPCYNEEEVLSVTADLFLGEIMELIDKNKIDGESRILFVNDGSKDSTWDVIVNLSKRDVHYIGVSQSRNRGHQNAVLAGLMVAKEKKADITVSIDCDGQDDICAIEKMVDKFYEGCDVVYGVRSDRETDTLFKKITAETFYKLLRGLGAEIVFNHADYRMLSYRMLCELSRYREVNLFLRGLVPLIGFKSGYVYYSRKKRIAGESHYPLKKMLSFAFDGITSLSIRPLHMIFGLGVVMSGLGMAGVVWTMIVAMTGKYRLGWDCIIYMLCFIGGMQLTCMGLLGEYIGKIYLEVKDRPRYIISDYTWEEGIHYNNQE